MDPRERASSPGRYRAGYYQGDFRANYYQDLQAAGESRGALWHGPARYEYDQFGRLAGYTTTPRNALTGRASYGGAAEPGPAVAAVLGARQTHDAHRVEAELVHREQMVEQATAAPGAREPGQVRVQSEGERVAVEAHAQLIIDERERQHRSRLQVLEREKRAKEDQLRRLEEQVGPGQPPGQPRGQAVVAEAEARRVEAEAARARQEADAQAVLERQRNQQLAQEAAAAARAEAEAAMAARDRAQQAAEAEAEAARVQAEVAKAAAAARMEQEREASRLAELAVELESRKREAEAAEAERLKAAAEVAAEVALFEKKQEADLRVWPLHLLRLTGHQAEAAARQIEMEAAKREEARQLAEKEIAMAAEQRAAAAREEEARVEAEKAKARAAAELELDKAEAQVDVEVSRSRVGAELGQAEVARMEIEREAMRMRAKQLVAEEEAQLEAEAARQAELNRIAEMEKHALKNAEIAKEAEEKRLAELAEMQARTEAAEQAALADIERKAAQAHLEQLERQKPVAPPPEPETDEETILIRKELAVRAATRDPEYVAAEYKLKQYKHAVENEFWEDGKKLWSKMAQKGVVSHSELEAEMARQALSHGYGYTFGAANSPTVGDSSDRWRPVPKAELPQAPAQLAVESPPASPERPPAELELVPAAVAKLQTDQEQGLIQLKFEQKSLALPSGELVRYLERSVDGSNRPPLVLLHDLGMDAIGMVVDSSGPVAQTLCA